MSAWLVAMLIAVAHGAGLYGLLQLQSPRDAIEETLPLLVSFVTAAATVQPEPPPPPAPVRPKREPRLLATSASLSASPRTPEPAPQPDPVVTETPPAPSSPTTEAVPPSFIAAYLDNPAPAYPPLSKRLGESGAVLLRVRVSVEGRGDVVELNGSSGYERLDQAALEAVRKWRFVPARQGEQNVVAWVLVPINFQLDHQ